MSCISSRGSSVLQDGAQHGWPHPGAAPQGLMGPGQAAAFTSRSPPLGNNSEELATKAHTNNTYKPGCSDRQLKSGFPHLPLI